MPSSSRARGCAHGRSGSISAVRPSSTAIIRSISASVLGEAGKMSPVNRSARRRRDRRRRSRRRGSARTSRGRARRSSRAARSGPARPTGPPSSSSAPRRLVGPQPAADAVARLQHDDRGAGLLQQVRRGQAAGAGSDDDHVTLDPTHAVSIRTAAPEDDLIDRVRRWKCADSAASEGSRDGIRRPMGSRTRTGASGGVSRGRSATRAPPARPRSRPRRCSTGRAGTRAAPRASCPRARAAARRGSRCASRSR